MAASAAGAAAAAAGGVEPKGLRARMISYREKGTTVMAELRATSPLDPEGGTLHAIDVFRLADDGRIASLEIYYR